MKRNRNLKITAISLLTASGFGMVLSGCAADKENIDESTTGQEIFIEDIETIEPVTDETIVIEPTTDEAAENKSAENTPDEDGDAQPSSTDTHETAQNSQSLYEQFLANNLAVTISSDHSENDYMEPIFEKGSSYTLAELGECVSRYFLDPEYANKTSYDYVQYAYVTCPDAPGTDTQNLLVKFVGLNLYTQDDDSYAVFVITEDNGQLFVTDEYQCWARSATTAYANGILRSSGSGGAGDHYDGLSALLSNGKQATIYDSEILSGWWTSYIGDAIYSEIFDENTECSLVVAIYTIGDVKYYQYDMSECSEEEKALCENYINRCREELGINWVAEEEIQTAIKNQCNAIGVDYDITQQQEEAAWNNL